MSGSNLNADRLSTVTLTVAAIAFSLAVAQLLYLYVGLSESYTRLLLY